MVHWNTYVPTPVSALIAVVGEFEVTIEAVLGPLTWDQVPVPFAAVFPAMVAVAVLTQMVWSGPALATVVPPVTLITTSSVVAVHGALLIVQRKV
jgi:hypothetical protein